VRNLKKAQAPRLSISLFQFNQFSLFNKRQKDWSSTLPKKGKGQSLLFFPGPGLELSKLPAVILPPFSPVTFTIVILHDHHMTTVISTIVTNDGRH
jgi:hypothetical protein